MNVWSRIKNQYFDSNGTKMLQALSGTICPDTVLLFESRMRHPALRVIFQPKTIRPKLFESKHFRQKKNRPRRFRSKFKFHWNFKFLGKFKIFAAKFEIFRKISKILPKFETFFIRNCAFSRKFEIFTKILNFCWNSKCSPQLKTFIQIQNFPQTPKFWNFRKISNLGESFQLRRTFWISAKI